MQSVAHFISWINSTTKSKKFGIQWIFIQTKSAHIIVWMKISLQTLKCSIHQRKNSSWTRNSTRCSRSTYFHCRLWWPGSLRWTSRPWRYSPWTRSQCNSPDSGYTRSVWYRSPHQSGHSPPEGSSLLKEKLHWL